jgi:hypothetical protein
MRHETIYIEAIDASIRALRSLIAKAMVDVTVACKDLEQEQHLAAIGAIMPLTETLQSAAALHAAVLVLNREIR